MVIVLLLVVIAILLAWFDSIRILKPEAMLVGYWHFRFQWERDWVRRFPGWRILTFGVFKLNEMPPEGAMLERKHYTGFLLRGSIWLPFEFSN